LLFSLW